MPIGGSLVMMAADMPAGDVDLTGEGTLDWVHWGHSAATSFDRKNSGDAIGPVIVVGASAQKAIVLTAVTASWTDGVPDAVVTRTSTATGISSPDGLQLEVLAEPNPHTLRLYVGGSNTRGRLDLHLSDSSAPDVSDNRFQGGPAAWHGLYTITYQSASLDQALVITWTDEADGVGGPCMVTSCFVQLLSATLQ